jgi:hypothetical protein
MHVRGFFPDGVFYVDLDNLRLEAIKHDVGSQLNLVVESEDELVAALSNRRALLVRGAWHCWHAVRGTAGTDGTAGTRCVARGTWHCWHVALLAHGVWHAVRGTAGT